MGVQKSLMLGFFCFTKGALLIFALHPLMEKIIKQTELLYVFLIVQSIPISKEKPCR